MIVTEDLSKSFDSFMAVEGLTLKVAPGEVLALLGPNGAGKTTLVRLLSSIFPPTRGKAFVAGYDVLKNPAQVRRNVGVLTEHHGLYTRMTAEEYLNFFGELYHLDPTTRNRRIIQLLTDFGLIEVKKRRIGQFSRGMQQKVSLARALLHEPPVLLLDEPTSAMDPESAFAVRDAIKNLRSSERTIIICTHNLAEAEALADQIAIIHQGRIIAQGTPDELKRTWLGLPEFEVRLATPIIPQNLILPDGLSVTAQGEGWLRFIPRQPENDNPSLLKSLLDQGIPVTTIVEVPRNLEMVYLRILNAQQSDDKYVH